MRSLRHARAYSSTSRNYALVILLISSASLLGVLHSTNAYRSVFGLGSVTLAPIRIETQFIPTQDEQQKATYLWSYVAEADLADDETTWDWVAKHRRKGYRRPSWGALRAQGAKAHVRDNLMQEKHYLTTFPAAGLSNEIMETCNLIAVAIRSNRIPLLTPFTPDWSHLHHQSSFLSVSEVFDLSELIFKYDTPIVDVLELKVGSEVGPRHRSLMYDGEHPRDDVRIGERIPAEKPGLDDIKCWDGYLSVEEEARGYVHVLHPAEFEGTPLPMSVYANRSDPQIWHGISIPLTAQAVAAYSSPSNTLPAESILRRAALGLPPSTMSPNDPFGCIHQLYFASLDPQKAEVRDEYREGIGVWDEVGRYLRFQPGLEVLAHDLLRALMGVGQGREIPPYMAVHIRRTDFGDEYGKVDQVQFAHQAWRLLREAKAEQGVTVKHVIFTTDEEDEEWLGVLRAMGWLHIDHAKVRTGDRLGWWFPTILDSIILSSANIFLGVPTSTMSILPYRRVLDWHGGIARFVQDPRTYVVPSDWEWNWAV